MADNPEPTTAEDEIVPQIVENVYAQRYVSKENFVSIKYDLPKNLPKNIAQIFWNLLQNILKISKRPFTNFSKKTFQTYFANYECCIWTMNMGGTQGWHFRREVRRKHMGHKYVTSIAVANDDDKV